MFTCGSNKLHQQDSSILFQILISLSLFVFPSIGKSSLTVQFVDSHFVDSYYPTIENTFQKTVKYKGQEFNLDIIDTAGQVRLPSFSFSFSNFSLPLHFYFTPTTLC